MEGIFIRRKPLLAVVISGMCALLAARFGEWFVRAVSRHEDAFTSVICGILFFLALGAGIFFLVILRWNRGAHLAVTETEFSASCHWNRKISLSLADILMVRAEFRSLHIMTKSYQTYEIHGLVNADEICSYIDTRESFRNREWVDCADTVIGNSDKKKRLRKRFLILCVVMSILMFAEIGITAMLTGGRDLSDFHERDKAIFYIFLILEAFTVVLAFVFAGKAGHMKTACVDTEWIRSEREKQRYRVIMEEIRTRYPSARALLLRRDGRLRSILYAQGEAAAPLRFFIAVEALSLGGEWMVSYSDGASYAEFSDAYQMGCRLLKEEEPLVIYMDG